MTDKSRTYRVGQIILTLCVLPFLMGMGGYPQTAPAAPAAIQADAQSYTTYLPLLRKDGFPLLVGVYPHRASNQADLDNEVNSMDAWITGSTTEKAISIVAVFSDFRVTDTNAKWNVEVPLTMIWNNGYTTFLNFFAPVKPGEIADGLYDRQLISWAKSYKNFANGGERFAYIAPLQEANGVWTTYGLNPGKFKEDYRHIRTIFDQVGVPAQSVKWVFAPNGWSDPSWPRFESYYPGDDQVDIVSFSAYNWGYFSTTIGAIWEEPDTVFNNPTMGTTYGYYLDRMRAMAPTKPIFIAETASGSSFTPGQKNYAEKDRWIRDAFAYLAKQKNVKGVLYFNAEKETDWPAYSINGLKYDGFRTGFNENGYKYLSPYHQMWLDYSMP